MTVGLAVLLAGAGALVAKRAGLFGGVTAAAWPGADLVNGIVPAVTTMKELEMRFGLYDHVGTYSNNLVWVRYRPAADSIATLTVWFDKAHVVRWARVVPAGAVSPEAMRASVRGLENIVSITPGNRFAGQSNPPGKLWSGGSGYLHVVEGRVEELWLIPMTVPHEAVTRAIRGDPVLPLDPGGVGLDAYRGG